jgi:asparagine synthetase A
VKADIEEQLCKQLGLMKVQVLLSVSRESGENDAGRRRQKRVTIEPWMRRLSPFVASR